MLKKINEFVLKYREGFFIFLLACCGFPFALGTASISFKSGGGYDEAGSRYGWIEVVNLDATVPQAEAFVRVPVITKGKMDAGTQKSKMVPAADKKPFVYVLDEKSGGFEIDVAACDSDLLVFLSQTVVGKYFRAFIPYGVSHYDTATSKNFQGFLFYALGMIECAGEINVPDGKTPKIIFNALPAPSAITITDSDLLAEVATVCNLETVAWAAFTATQPLGEMSEPCSCKMN